MNRSTFFNFLILVLFGILQFPLSVFATEKTSTANKNDPAPSTSEIVATQDVPVQAPVQAPVMPLQNSESGRYLQIKSGYGYYSSSLSGNGFNTNIPGKTDFVYGIGFAYQSPDSGTRYIFDYSKIEFDQTVPDGLNPSLASFIREEFKFSVSFTPWQEGRWQNVRLGLGYSHLRSSASETSPNNILTNQVSQGINLSSSYKSYFSEKLNLIYSLELYLPHQIKETTQTTGVNPKYFGFETSAIIEYSWLKNLLFYSGVNYRLDQVSYDGTGSRGVTNGKDIRTLITIPLGLKISY